MNNVASLLAVGEDMLHSAGIPNPGREASSLLEFALYRSRAFIVAHPEYEPAEAELVRYSSYIQRRADREPFHYITGIKEFYGVDFAVSPAVLIPRPETEMLVERGIDKLKSLENPRFCEVGVGSGCISVAILANLAQATAVGLEISDPAIEIARQNAVKHSVDDRLDLRSSDVFSGLNAKEEFDLIVSNPPYVPFSCIEGLQQEVRGYEPKVALTDGSDGLSIIRRIVEESPRFLRPGGYLILEMGIGQAEAVCDMFRMDVWASAVLEHDLQDIPRLAAATLANR